MKVIDCEQQSEEWFRVRLGKITGSHFADVLNKATGRKTYIYKVLSEKLSGEPAPSYSNKAMEFGAEYEADARAYYKALYGEIQQVGFVVMNEHIGCSPDGLVGIEGILEIKYPFPSTHLSYIVKNSLPAIYKPQVQGNLWVTERKWCDFVSYNAKIKAKPFWKIRVYRDEEYIETLQVATEKFIKEMVELENRITNKTMNF